MTIVSHPIMPRRRAAFSARTGVLGAKRIAGIGTGCMCMCTDRIRGCRPGTAARPGEQRD